MFGPWVFSPCVFFPVSHPWIVLTLIQIMATCGWLYVGDNYSTQSTIVKLKVLSPWSYCSPMVNPTKSFFFTHGFFHSEIVENYTVPGPPQRYGVSHPVFRPGMWDFSVVDNGIISEDGTRVSWRWWTWGCVSDHESWGCFLLNCCFFLCILEFNRWPLLAI